MKTNSGDNSTQMVVINAFERLLSTQRFESISIAQICKEAGVSRSTFYYYFKDKYDLSQWHFNKTTEKYLFETGRTLNWFQANFLNTSALANHKILYRECFSIQGYESLFAHAKRRRIETLRETIIDYKHESLDDELEFQIIALADAEVGGIAHWFSNEMPYSVKRISQYLDDIVPRRLYHLLNDPASKSFSNLVDLMLEHRDS